MKKGTWILLFLTPILFSIGAFWILPAQDDYFYLSSPQTNFDMNKFLPNGVFWRPIDYAFGLLSGLFINLFPLLNHLIIILAYILTLFETYILLKRCKIKGFTLFVSLSLFICSPMLVATNYSIDSINQILANTFGVCSLLVYKDKKWLSYLFMILAVLSKESGIAWFAVTPALNEWIIENKTPLKLNSKSNIIDSLKKISYLYCIPILLIIIYTICRSALFVEGTETTLSRYNSFSLVNVVKGLALLWGSVITCIDTIAFFIEKNYVIVGLTLIVSFAFLYIILKNIKYKGNVWRIFILLCSALAISSPHVVIEHPGEMHAYPTLWIFAFSLGILLKDVRWKIHEKVIIYVFLFVSTIVFFHKAFYIFNNGRQAFSRVKSAVENTPFIPKHVFVLDLDEEKSIYSVFQTTGKEQWVNGAATRLYFDCKNPEIIEYRCADIKDKDLILKEIISNKGNIECIWIVKNNIVKTIDLRN